MEVFGFIWQAASTSDIRELTIHHRVFMVFLTRSYVRVEGIADAKRNTDWASNLRNHQLIGGSGLTAESVSLTSNIESVGDWETLSSISFEWQGILVTVSTS